MHLGASCIVLAAGLLIAPSAAHASQAGSAPSAVKSSHPAAGTRTPAASESGNSTAAGNSTTAGNSTDGDNNAVYSYPFIWSQAQQAAEDAQDGNYTDPGIYSNASLIFPAPMANFTLPPVTWASGNFTANSTTPAQPADNNTSATAEPVRRRLAWQRDAGRALYPYKGYNA